MTWYVGPVVLTGKEEPTTVRDTAPHKVQAAAVLGWTNPILYSLGMQAETLTLRCFLEDATAQMIKELSRNVYMQPSRVVAPDDYGGFFWIRSFQREKSGGVKSWRRAQLDLYRVGTTGSHPVSYTHLTLPTKA